MRNFRCTAVESVKFNSISETVTMSELGGDCTLALYERGLTLFGIELTTESAANKTIIVIDS